MTQPTSAVPITVRVAGEIVCHESVVLEAYLDSKRVWTWSAGITAASGINVLAYKDKPASIAVCLAAYIARLRKVYVPDVLSAFRGRMLTEAQFAAALSFHYNTGAIGRTSWVTLWLAGRFKEARAFIETHYDDDAPDRRKAEAALFFDGRWSGDGTTMVYPVSKPSYQPVFSKGKRVAINGALATALGLPA